MAEKVERAAFQVIDPYDTIAELKPSFGCRTILVDLVNKNSFTKGLGLKAILRSDVTLGRNKVCVGIV